MKYLLKTFIYIGLVSSYALGDANLNSQQTNYKQLDASVAFFASADEDGRKIKKKKKVVKKKKKKKRLQSRIKRG